LAVFFEESDGIFLYQKKELLQIHEVVDMG
jgi:hypothetical protein